MPLHTAMVVASFWRMMTLLTHVLLEIHCLSYIIFCHPEGSAAAFWSICATVTVKQDPTCAQCFARAAAAAYSNAMELEKHAGSLL